MGNKSAGSQSKYGQIYVKTQKSAYYSGEQVSGNIFLIIKEQYPGFCVNLKVKGYEFVQWREQQTRQRTERDAYGNPSIVNEVYYINNEGKNIFYWHKIKIHQWVNSKVPIGSYSIPFQFVLQSNLPGSFEEITEDYKAKVKFKIKAELEPLTNSVQKLKYTQDLIIQDISLKELQLAQPEVKESKEQFNLLCCISQGTCKISCALDKRVYQSGETANLTIIADNRNCKLNVTNIKCRLMQQLSLTTNKGKQQKFAYQVYQSDEVGVLNGQSTQIYTKIPLQQNSDYKSGKIQPCVNGSLLNCSYILNIKATLDGFTIQEINQVNADIPVNISFDYSQQDNLQIPQNWNPQIFQLKNITFQASDLYTKQIDLKSLQIQNETMQNQPQMSQAIKTDQAIINIQNNQSQSSPMQQKGYQQELQSVFKKI